MKKKGVSSLDCGPVTTVASVLRVPHCSTYQLLGLGQLKAVFKLPFTEGEVNWIHVKMLSHWSRWSDGCQQTWWMHVRFDVWMQTDACNKLVSGAGSVLILTVMVTDSSNLSFREHFGSLGLLKFGFLWLGFISLWLRYFVCDTRAISCPPT